MAYDGPHEGFYLADGNIKLSDNEVIALRSILTNGGFLIIDDYGHWAGSRKARHPFINSELGQYMDHMKGYDRKAQMSSKKRDLTTKQTHPYWKTLKD